VLHAWIIALVSLCYLGILFAIAYYGDQRADKNRSLINNPYIYTLSIAVYCTSWTFYGSVGRAATSGVGFLPIYIGPTLTFILGWFVLRKIVRISAVNRITSIADFISSRYGKNPALGGLVTIIAVIGIMPYISLQLKAVSTSFSVLSNYPEIVMPHHVGVVPMLQDTGFYVALIMAAFSILFGTRHIDASEHHEGMVAAVAFESVVKLLAFMAVGYFVTFELYGGFGDLFSKVLANPELAKLTTLEAAGGYESWFFLTILSMMAIICLPRQFQVAVVENVDEAHIKKAVWLFPLYLLLINIFVLPIAFGGLLHFPQAQVDADTFVLTLPMVERQEGLALLAFIGGLSAATGMIIVATIALSTMVCNDLVMPFLLRTGLFRLSAKGDLSGLLLAIRRATIIAILLLGYLYVRLIGDSYALVSIGLVSFAAAAQFAPAILGGIYWRWGSRAGAVAGLSAGFLIWAYCLLLPSFARSGWLPIDILDIGPFGVEALKPYALFGLAGLDPIAHGLFWSLLANIGLFVVVSHLSRQSPLERSQAILFVDVFKRPTYGAGPWRGQANLVDLRNLLARFLGQTRAAKTFADYAEARAAMLSDASPVDAGVVQYAERQLAGAIGSASARIMVASVVKEEPPDINQVMQILDEASQIREYSRQLEAQSAKLRATTEELKAANERLKELDQLKNDFVATVSHELRTPLTSIRMFSEILYDTPSMEEAQRTEFLGIIIKESERLTRLINNILDLAKMEAGRFEWQMSDTDPNSVLDDALAATSSLFQTDPTIRLTTKIPSTLPCVHVDRDRLTQVVVNLISNAVKFCAAENGWVGVEADVRDDSLLVTIADNGKGVAKADQQRIFDKFQQASDSADGRRHGTGLGLPISLQIIQHFGGQIWVESEPGKGARFFFTIPVRQADIATKETAAASS
jgi:Na+/proline symporter/nitrogen-specific signal transduction histidine kinase